MEVFYCFGPLAGEGASDNLKSSALVDDEAIVVHCKEKGDSLSGQKDLFLMEVRRDRLFSTLSNILGVFLKFSCECSLRTHVICVGWR